MLTFIDDPTEERICGECTACCTIMEVRELKKPLHQRCVHVDKGCAIYPERPPSCRDFSCQWRSGHLEGGERPDLFGLMFIAPPLGIEAPYTIAHEVWPGALAIHEEEIVSLAKQCIVIVIPFNKRLPTHILGPDVLMMQFKQFRHLMKKVA